MSWIRRIVKGAFLFIPPYMAFTDLFYAVRTVDGVSMQPTLNPDGFNTDFVLLDRWAATSLQFERGDVVSLISPKDPSQWLIKRIVALEGDQVKANSCFEENVDIPRGHCWVEGDNHDCSMDSNNFGPVSIGLITAKASRVLWPLERWGPLEKKDISGGRLTVKENVDRGKVFFGWESWK
ncbi:mitochondrial inner membrane protease subunit 2-like [Physella acuta]|uniref:mitochondrial inner membrane protease subunit 2-like n=1 Tax=Physella acuta TaxID=109671 RepID=UPI0027DE342C|nr:mitochondrial inner membrane protease subunit 2-like [Physella acuta]